MAADEDGTNLFASLAQRHGLRAARGGDRPDLAAVSSLKELLTRGQAVHPGSRPWCVLATTHAAPDGCLHALAKMLIGTPASRHGNVHMLVPPQYREPTYDERKVGVYQQSQSLPGMTMVAHLGNEEWRHMHAKLIVCAYAKGSLGSLEWTHMRFIVATENIGELADARGGQIHMPQQYFTLDFGFNDSDVVGCDEVPQLREFLMTAMSVVADDKKRDAGMRMQIRNWWIGDSPSRGGILGMFDLQPPANVQIVSSLPVRRASGAPGSGVASLEEAISRLKRDSKLEANDGDEVKILYYTSTLSIGSLHQVKSRIERAISTPFNDKNVTASLRVVFPAAGLTRQNHRGKVFGPTESEWDDLGDRVRDCFVKYEPKYACIPQFPHAKTLLAFIAPSNGGPSKLWFVLSGSHGISRPAWIGGSYEVSVIIAPQDQVARDRLLERVYWKDDAQPYGADDKPITAA